MSIEAMKLALKAIESEGWCDTEPVIAALKEALAQSQSDVKQEPVAEPHKSTKCVGEPVAPNHSNNSQNSFKTRMDIGFVGGAQKQDQGEPVGQCIAKGVIRWNKSYPEVGTKLYTTSQQRTWVGLTDEEIFETHKQVDSMQYLTFGKAIEDKLKEKNT